MDFLYKKSASKPGEEYITMTGKTIEEIEDEIKNLKAKVIGDNKNKKWSNDLGNKIIEEVSANPSPFPILLEIFSKKQIIAK